MLSQAQAPSRKKRRMVNQSVMNALYARCEPLSIFEAEALLPANVRIPRPNWYTKVYLGVDDDSSIYTFFALESVSGIAVFNVMKYTPLGEEDFDEFGVDYDTWRTLTEEYE